MGFRESFLAFLHAAEPGCRLRYAPTPSGFLHIGNALNFTLNWLVARQQGGRILLRIDDLDADRKRPEYVADIFESLEWLGLDWDEIPSGSITNLMSPPSIEPWSQYQRLPLYVEVLESLRHTGLLFACQKSRRELASFEGAYPLAFRQQMLSLDAPDVAWRIATPPGFPLPDFVVRRRDGLPAYQVASMADDLFFGITHIIRGADLEASTAAQQYLAEVLSKPECYSGLQGSASTSAQQDSAEVLRTPEGHSGLQDKSDFLKIKILHHPLITDEQGEKLSKSKGASSLRAMRERGIGPESVFRQAAALLGLEEDCDSADALRQAVSEDILKSSPPLSQ